MISIESLLPKENFEVEVVKGFFCTVRPITDFDMKVARTEAQTLVNDINAGLKSLEDAGIVSTAKNGYDPKKLGHASALYQHLLNKHLALNHIEAWKGFGNVDTGEEYPPTPQYIALLFNDFKISEAFFARVTAYHAELIFAKKGSASGARGKHTEAMTTASDVTNRKLPAPGASSASTENAAPS